MKKKSATVPKSTPEPLFETELTKRIYSVVAQRVQAPLNEEYVYTSNFGGVNILKPIPTMVTRTIKQPAGRIIAQHGHVVSKVREHMFKERIRQAIANQAGIKLGGLLTGKAGEFEPITTIVLSVHNSFELYHIFGLLTLGSIRVHAFYDTDQPDYGDPDYKVMTAIATSPIDPEETTGILDYLPLWKPEEEA